MPAENFIEPGFDNHQWQGVLERERLQVIRIFAGAVFGLITLVTAGIIIDWLIRSPATPAWPATLSPATQEAALQNFEKLNKISMERAKDLFDLIIAKGLLPLFATIIGVLLGRRAD